MLSRLVLSSLFLISRRTCSGLRHLAMTSKHAVGSKNVAVIGAGAAGLATARYLRDSGLKVSVMERSSQVGGVWRYTPTSVIYKGLVTNLPKQIMAFYDYPFPDEQPSFQPHVNIQDYLESFATQYKLRPLIQLDCQVTSVEKILVPDADESEQEQVQWKVTTSSGNQGEGEERLFDYVVVANGHYNKPFTPHIDGIKSFEGKSLHSMYYDDPSQFKGMKVLCIGARSSGTDVAREVAGVASEVHVCDRSVRETSKGGAQGNIWRHPEIQTFAGSNGVTFTDGSTADVDCVIYCTGFDYEFKFLGPSCQVEAGDGRVHPLYKQIFHCDHPSLSFVGLPHSVVPFPLFALQAQVIARVYTGQLDLPGSEERHSWLQSQYENIPEVKETHYLGPQQWEYKKDLARLAGCLDDALLKHLALQEDIYNHASKARPSFPGGPDHYRRQEFAVDAEAGTFVATGGSV
ncbi:unnamed protein product [Chrysoparadoxa australica]